MIVGPAFPLRGGIANFNEALCHAFLKSGTDSQIVSFTLQYPAFLFPGKTQYDTSGKCPEGITVSPMINSVNPFSWIKAADFIRKQKPDYVIFRFWLPFMAPCLGTIAWLIRRNRNIKVIALCDNIIPHEKRMGDNLLTHYFVRQCDGFIAMSGSVLRDLQKFTDTPFKIFTPHPVYDIFGQKVAKENARKQLGLSREGKYILFFGFIRKYKGLDLLLEAMADERVKSLNIHLIIAGEFYEDEAYYNEIIRKNGLEKNIVRRTEFIPSEDVKHYFCAADMVVQPYRTATQSGVTQIAYHFDRPMLVTDVGGLSEIVPHGKVGYVCKTHPGSISEALTDFYSNQRENDFVRNVQTEKQRFSWDHFVRETEILVQKISSA